MKRIKGFLSIVLTASVLTACIPAYADGEITAEEVRTLIEANLLSKQSYCEEILDTLVYNADNIFETKTLRDYIDPEKTIIESRYEVTREILLPQTADEIYFLSYLTEDNSTLDISVSNDLMVEGIGTSRLVYNAFGKKRAQVRNETMWLDGEIFPFCYLNYEKTAKLINRYKLKNITEIAFHSPSLIIRADGKLYETAWNGSWEMYGDDIENTDDSTETDDGYMKRQKDMLEKMRAVTPDDLVRYLEPRRIETKKTDSLSKYQNTPAVFSDLGDDKFLCSASALLKDRGIITGFEDGTLRPESTLTRGEASVMLRKLVRGDYTGEDFPDTQNHWAKDAVNYLTGAGVIHGYDDGLFRPDTNLTYEQACSLIYSIMGYNANFFETDKMFKMMTLGLFEGISSFTKEKPISRSDFVKLIANALDTPIGVDYPHIYATALGSVNDLSFLYVLDITLISYLDGKEPLNGVYCLSFEAYKAFEDDVKARCYEAYKDLKE